MRKNLVDEGTARRVARELNILGFGSCVYEVLDGEHGLFELNGECGVGDKS